MKVLICGDWNWTNIQLIREWLIKLKNEGYDTVIEGEARGADSIARDLALLLNMKIESYPADWSKYGRSAGPIRNTQMLKEGKPDFVLAFHNNIASSKGTANMLKQVEGKVKSKLVTEYEER